MTKAEYIIAAAGTMGRLIELIADMLGEPVAEVRKRVLLQIAKDAADPSDETDSIYDTINEALPD